MNQTNKFAQSYQKPSPLNNNTYTEQQRISQQSKKKSSGFRYHKQSQGEAIESFQQYNDDKPKPMEIQEDFQLTTGFFFKNNVHVQLKGPQPQQQLKISDNLSFRKSPSFRVKHHHQLNQSSDNNRNADYSDHNSEQKVLIKKNTQSNRSDSSNPHLLDKQPNDRRTRIAALENYIKDITEDNISKKVTPTPLHSNNSNNASAYKPQSGNIAEQKQQKGQALESTSHTGYASTAYPSILDDLEANIEEMHFHFVEFQQKSKNWMAKIETKQRKP